MGTIFTYDFLTIFLDTLAQGGYNAINTLVQGVERSCVMPIIKLSLTNEELAELQNLLSADETTENMSIQDFIRFRLLGKSNPQIFTPEEAVRRALEKFSSEDNPFTLPDIYGEDWTSLNPRMTGVFGKKFFNYLKNKESALMYAGMTVDNRRATYRVKED